jgi:N-methylhydantoinase A/oxoprolinase/acetone carboxylase beta subunit
MRGAAYLTGATDALVADVGGTSTDVGVLAHGFPRESSAGVEIGGVRTNFRMPDILSIALGGGSVVSGANDAVSVGPTSVGYRLREEALVFGGSTATVTDAAVAGGRAAIGDASALDGHRELLEQALLHADDLIAGAIDRVKLVRGDRPLIVVGGGSVIVPDRLPGVSEVLRPPHADVANAIGAAIAAVSGQIDRIFHPGAGGRDAVLEQACAEAREQAIRAGADPGSVEIVELDEIPLAYVTNYSTRIRAKAAGPLAV